MLLVFLIFAAHCSDIATIYYSYIITMTTVKEYKNITLFKCILKFTDGTVIPIEPTNKIKIVIFFC